MTVSRTSLERDHDASYVMRTALAMKRAVALVTTLNAVSWRASDTRSSAISSLFHMVCVEPDLLFIGQTDEIGDRRAPARCQFDADSF